MLTVMGAIKVTQKGQVVIPAEFRKNTVSKHLAMFCLQNGKGTS